MLTVLRRTSIAALSVGAALPLCAQIVDGGSSYIQSFSPKTALLGAALPPHPGMTFKLTRVWVKVRGDGKNTGDFFATCSGIGPTILVADVEAPFGYPNILPGAYNGQSWDPTLTNCSPSGPVLSGESFLFRLDPAGFSLPGGFATYAYQLGAEVCSSPLRFGAESFELETPLLEGARASSTSINYERPPGGVGLFGASGSGMVYWSVARIEVFRVEWIPGINVNTLCVPLSNSTGGGAVTHFTGTTSLLANDLVLHTDGLPSIHTTGYYIVGQGTGIIDMPGNTRGRLCIAGAPIGRYNQNVLFGASVQASVNMLQIPTPSGPIGVHPGETWRFQYWYRDVGPTGAATSNFCAGLEIQVQ